MYLNLFVKDESLEFYYGSAAKMIQSLRANFLAEGGNTKDFPEFLKSAGVELVGPLIKISEEFALISTLKYGK